MSQVYGPWGSRPAEGSTGWQGAGRAHIAGRGDGPGRGPGDGEWGTGEAPSRRTAADMSGWRGRGGQAWGTPAPRALLWTKWRIWEQSSAMASEDKPLGVGVSTDCLLYTSRCV